MELVGRGGGSSADEDDALEVAVQTLQLVGDHHRENTTGKWRGGGVMVKGCGLRGDG